MFGGSLGTEGDSHPLRILTPEGFKDCNLKDGLVFWEKEDLEELLDYLKAKEAPATAQLLSANSRTPYKNQVESPFLV